MKKEFLSLCMAVLLSLASCSKEAPNPLSGKEDEVIKVEEIVWKADLKDGRELALNDKSLNLANRMDIIPSDATDQNQTFSSSNTLIATISAYGQVTPIALGTTQITVSVDDKEASFMLTVVEPKLPPVIEVSGLELSQSGIEIVAGSSKSILSFVTVLPAKAADKSLSYASSDVTIATVDASGTVSGISEGSATITISSKSKPEIKVQLSVSVSAFYGDYPRSKWSISLDPIGVVTEEAGNSPQGAYDGNTQTFLGIVKPGKTWKTIPNNETYVHFILDLGEELSFNYFRIRHRNEKELFLRFRKFSQISGSNDGVNYTQIASNVAIPEHETASKIETPDIRLPLSKYRYIRFLANSDDECWDTAKGSTLQISELYVGITK